jgi:2-keto-4-pentenoate hydratase/2-oxohepta-3-ene-1,7-dioic acid hydratase in catechol pathway
MSASFDNTSHTATQHRKDDPKAMRLCTIRTSAGSEPAVLISGAGAVTTRVLLGRSVETLREHFMREELPEIAAASADWTAQRGIADPEPDFDAPYRDPRKILGIGLNYRAHASDLGESAPRTSPASFIKGDHTIVGPGETIEVPPGIGKVTSEGELGLVIGRTCWQVSEDDAMSYVAGVCAILDQTAEAVLLENPRYLTRVKNYPTFFSFGPVIVTMDEVAEIVPDLAELVVTTRHNGQIGPQAPVRDMMFSPSELLSFHSQVMPFYPGDILSTGTPGAVPINPGDVVTCELGDLMTLTNPIGDQGVSRRTAPTG